MPTTDPDDLNLMVPILDWASLWKRLRKDMAVTRALESVLAHHAESTLRLQELIRSQDSEGLQALAHRLRSVAGMFGALPTQEAAAQLEDFIRVQHRFNEELAVQLLGQLHQFLEQARVGLANLDATRPKPPETR